MCSSDLLVTRALCGIWRGFDLFGVSRIECQSSCKWLRSGKLGCNEWWGGCISVDHGCMGCRIGYFHAFFQCGVFRCSVFFFVRFQKNGTQSRTQSQRVQCGQTDSDSHSHTELTIECSCCTSHETYRNEYGHHSTK